MTALRLIDADIERAIGRLPKVTVEAPEAREVAAGTPEARNLLAVKRFLLLAKGRLKSIERRPDPGSTDAWGR